MTAPRRPMATPRNRNWAPEQPSRWRPWLEALLLLAVLIACGIDGVRW